MSRAGDVRLPIIVIGVSEQRYSCHGCGNCCRDFTVQLRPDDLARLERQGWKEKLGEEVTVEFRGQTFLRQRDDGACIFWMADGKCRIHAEHGFEEKPIACQLFPFSIVPGERDAAVGVNFACGSVLESKGKSLSTHRDELVRMTARVPETVAAPVPIMLAEGLVATADEIDALVRGCERWMQRRDVPLAIRLDGLAWLSQSLSAATLTGVRGKRFAELVDTLVAAMPDELAHLPIEPATGRQIALLRQAVFGRTEDPKIPSLAKRGRLRTTLSQLSRSRAFRRGSGKVPRIGDGFAEGIAFADVAKVRPLMESPDLAAIDELLVRYHRASLHGRRLWGAGYYGWSVRDGLAAHVLNVACVGWLAQVRAAGAGRTAPSIDDVRVALGRVDRMAGRAPWLGAVTERLRLRYLALDDGLRRVVAAVVRA
ncbi:MAG: YkgJ family cysteine cluster protein [Phycisphaerae bacterium]|nr:YkgJ family cysteine cluster protein [Phycisphaerae bacterium]